MSVFGGPKYCSIIIVTYRSIACIGECLDRLIAMSNVEIIIVDNDSKDGTSALIEQGFPSIKVIALNENLGFGRACNIGVAASSSSFFVFLNPDAVASPDALKTLVTFLEDHPQAGIVGARLIDPLGQPLQSMGDSPSLLGLVLDKPIAWVAQRVGPRGLLRMFIGRISAKFRLPSKPESVPWVSGAALCCRRSTWEDLSGFDEKFFLYFEDVDLCLRSTQAGWEVWHVPEAVVSHQSGASFAGNQDFQKGVYFSNQQYFFQKHCGRLSAFCLSLLQGVYSRLKLYRQFANDRIGPSV
ncbi:MAG: glycosyltransferase family 2 protein [Nitrospirales bacterium]